MLTPVLHYFLEAFRSCATVVGVSTVELALWLAGVVLSLAAALALGGRTRVGR